MLGFNQRTECVEMWVMTQTHAECVSVLKSVLTEASNL